MAQHAVLEIALAAERIDERAVPGLRHRVDGEIAPAQIVFQRHLGRRVHGEALVAAPAFPFRARERVFLVRLRMQEHGKVLADGLVAQALHLVGGRADDNVVAVLHGQAEQLIAHGAADDVGLHP